RPDGWPAPPGTTATAHNDEFVDSFREMGLAPEREGDVRQRSECDEAQPVRIRDEKIGGTVRFVGGVARALTNHNLGVAPLKEPPRVIGRLRRGRVTKDASDRGNRDFALREGQ